MGLAAPRSRTKIQHDPRNLTWSTNSASYGARLMEAQGWSHGQALGADSSAAPQKAYVGVLHKDDNLGLGAQLKSKDVAHQRTGLDAFQGLLGRLNAKDQAELKEVERKEEDRKLRMWGEGRWGRMMFVPGGLLVQGDEFKSKKEAKEKFDAKEQQGDSTPDEHTRLDAGRGPRIGRKRKHDASGLTGGGEADVKTKAAKKIGKEGRRKNKSAEPQQSPTITEEEARRIAKRQRKEERRKAREEKKACKAAKAANSSAISAATTCATTLLPPDEPVSSDSNDKQPRPSAGDLRTHQKQILKNRRHLLRGRNIEAKRKAFSDMKGLDAIFMRT